MTCLVFLCSPRRLPPAEGRWLGEGREATCKPRRRPLDLRGWQPCTWQRHGSANSDPTTPGGRTQFPGANPDLA